MARLDSLTALALGRTAFDPNVVNPQAQSEHSRQATETGRYVQEYTVNGRPVNPETRRRERAVVRAANEILQATGVVEDAEKSKQKHQDEIDALNKETSLGVKLFELGGFMLVCGIWGFIGFRRRVIVSYSPSKPSLFQYQPYLSYTDHMRNSVSSTWSALS